MFMTPMLLGLAQAAAAMPAASSHITLHKHKIRIEIAADEASREHGLMDRTALARGHGMLFVFPDTAPRWFWMKNTLISLDIVYFDHNASVVSMQLNVPPCSHDPCPTYASNLPARYALELPGGSVGRLHIKVGDKMTLPTKPIVAH
ncbi:MAG: DUF192 domain-containing protein [Xanthomonadales bacterium]|nr:DUF192 domain-containing protein [Xanthomonadales bacterium]